MYLLGEIGTNECVDDIRESTECEKPSPVFQRRNVTGDDIEHIKQCLVSKGAYQLGRLASFQSLKRVTNLTNAKADRCLACRNYDKP